MQTVKLPIKYLPLRRSWVITAINFPATQLMSINARELNSVIEIIMIRKMIIVFFFTDWVLVDARPEWSE